MTTTWSPVGHSVTPVARTVITGARVLLNRSLQQADITIHDGVIVGLQPPQHATEPPPPPEAQVVHATGLIVLPGLVDAHTHSFAQLCRDAVARDRLEAWLPLSIASSTGLTAEAAFVAAQLSALDGLRHGVTTTLDHATLAAGTADSMIAAYQQAGSRVVLAAQISDVPYADSLHGIDPTSLTELRHIDTRLVGTTADQLARCQELVTAAQASPLATAMFGPSTPERCSDRLLEEVAQLAESCDVGLHVHALESQQQRNGGGSISRLQRHGLLTSRLSIAHAVHLNDDDIHRLHHADASVVHNPFSNLFLGSGRQHLRRLLDGGVTVGLGCDGWTSGGAQDLIAQARLAMVLNRPDTPPEDWLTAAEVWDAATNGGASAVNLGGSIGALTVGSQADLLLIDPARSGWLTGVDIVEQIVAGGLAAGLRQVWVAGQPVLADSSSLRLDDAALVHHAESLLPHLRRDAAAAHPLAIKIASFVSRQLDKIAPAKENS